MSYVVTKSHKYAKFGQALSKASGNWGAFLDTHLTTKLHFHDPLQQKESKTNIKRCTKHLKLFHSTESTMLCTYSQMNQWARILWVFAMIHGAQMDVICFPSAFRIIVKLQPVGEHTIPRGSRLESQSIPGSLAFSASLYTWSCSFLLSFLDVSLYLHPWKLQYSKASMQSDCRLPRMCEERFRFQVVPVPQLALCEKESQDMPSIKDRSSVTWSCTIRRIASMKVVSGWKESTSSALKASSTASPHALMTLGHEITATWCLPCDPGNYSILGLCTQIGIYTLEAYAKI